MWPLLMKAAEDPEHRHFSNDSLCEKNFSNVQENKGKKNHWSGAALIVILIWMRKHLNKRAISGREVKGFTFNKHRTKTTLNQKKYALKGIYKAFISVCLWACVCVVTYTRVFICACHTRTHTGVIYSKHRASKLKQVFQVGFQLQV